MIYSKPNVYLNLKMYGRFHGINKHSTDRAIIGGKEWKYFRKVDDL